MRILTTAASIALNASSWMDISSPAQISGLLSQILRLFLAGINLILEPGSRETHLTSQQPSLHVFNHPTHLPGSYRCQEHWGALIDPYAASITTPKVSAVGLM